jgi:hypothetical protein
VNADSLCTEEHIAAMVGSYGASKSTKLQWRAAVAPVLRFNHAKRALDRAEASLQGFAASLAYLTTYAPH